MTYNLTVSVVLFNTDEDEILNITNIISESNLKTKLFFIDNSPSKNLEKLISTDSDVEYIHTGENLGFGAGHNVAINITKNISEFHLVLNADVNFEANILEEIYNFMKKNDEIGLLAPKILNPDGSIQYSAKLLPSPANLIIRRFVPIKSIQEKMDYNYEFHFFGFNKIIDVPYVMGCFMFMNTRALNVVKGFDERFFMYPEDIDLTRRIHENFRTIYYPKTVITHKHGKGSYKSSKLLYFHVTSMIKYFNKWGWFLDKDRRKVNRKILTQFKDIK
jgi:GT2 family glycosyltransferase